MKKYIPSDIEPKWQKKWREDNLYLTDLSKTENKYYVLVELPYTSGGLHMGHWFTFTMGDILARFKTRQGFNVLFPNGFDTFGLPAENAAITNNMHPKDWTYANIAQMRQQFATMGVSIDWEKTAITCDPRYFRWNQWIFLKMYERRIAYRGKAFSNWCPSCQTVLANENVESGRCWRCSTEVIQKEVEQWFLKLTEYADRLMWTDPPQVDWPKPLIEGQNAWIGKSEGMDIVFKVDGSSDEIVAYTVFPETIFGVTYMVLAPEHPLTSKLVTSKKQKEVNDYIKASQKKSELERKILEREKTGVFTNFYCINPVNNKKVPIWIADYVIAAYGTGAVMGVPGSDHRDFEFAKKYDLEIIRVISKTARDKSEVVTTDDVLEEGVLVNSGEFSGLKTSSEAREKIKHWLEKNARGRRKIQYHLHDWSISRQRYWGTPIPIIYCDKCGTVPVPEADLPVELPYAVDYTPKGKPPLATVEDWVNVKCPNCGGQAQREVETMDGFVDNSWYFYRYLDHKNSKEIFNKRVVEDWIPVNIYIGGAEHTVGHTLYSRFFTKFFHDLGLISFDEYAQKRVHHGVILGPDGARMSKSRGNVVNPDEEVKQYGADAIRVYLMFLGPFDIVTPWNPDGVNGAYRFLQRVWGLQDHLTMDNGQWTNKKLSIEDLRMMHKTIKKVTEDLENLKYNTAIAGLMEWLNHLSRKEQVSKEEYQIMLLLLAPFAPHITEELWQMVNGQLTIDNGQRKKKQMSNVWSIHQQSWPQFDDKYLVEEEVKIAVQVNGKLRDLLLINKDMVRSREVVEKMALEAPNVKKFLAGDAVKKVVYVPGKIISLVVSK